MVVLKGQQKALDLNLYIAKDCSAPKVKRTFAGASTSVATDYSYICVNYSLATTTSPPLLKYINSIVYPLNRRVSYLYNIDILIKAASLPSAVKQSFLEVLIVSVQNKRGGYS